MKPIKKLTTNLAQNYIYYNYGYLKHDIKKLVLSCRQIAKQYKVKPLQIFFFMIENKPINQLYTHSYNFNTATGREIKQQFKSIYYEQRTSKK